MNPVHANQKGFTLIEIIVVMMLLGIMGAMTFRVVASGVEGFVMAKERKELYDEARLALERMVRELRTSSQITTPEPGSSGSSLNFTKASYGYAGGAPYDNSTDITFQLNGSTLEREGDASGTVGLASHVSQFSVTHEGSSGGTEAITFNSESHTVDGGSSISWDHTFSEGSNKILIVAIGVENDDVGEEAVTSITYNGKALTPINTARTEASGYYAATGLWYLLDADFPSSPGSYPINITFSGSLLSNCTGAAAIVINGAAQQGPEAQASSNGPGDPISLSLTTQTDGAWIIDTVSNGNQGGYFPQNGQTERYDYETYSSTHAGGTLEVPTAGLQTVGWDHSNHRRSCMCAAAFASAAATPVTTGVILGLTLTSPTGGDVSMRTKVLPRNME